MPGIRTTAMNSGALSLVGSNEWRVQHGITMRLPMRLRCGGGEMGLSRVVFCPIPL